MCVSPAWGVCLLLAERVESGTSSGLSTHILGEVGRNKSSECNKTGNRETVLVREDELVLVLLPLGTRRCSKLGFKIISHLPQPKCTPGLRSSQPMGAWSFPFFVCFQNSLAWYCMESSSFPSYPLGATCPGLAASPVSLQHS